MMRLKPKGKSACLCTLSCKSNNRSSYLALTGEPAAEISVLLTCYSFTAHINSASAPVVSALMIFWSSTHVMTVLPSTAQHRTLTVASGRPSTCRGLEEYRRAGVHPW